MNKLRINNFIKRVLIFIACIVIIYSSSIIYNNIIINNDSLFERYDQEILEIDNNLNNKSFDDGFESGLQRAVLLERESKSIQEYYDKTYDKDIYAEDYKFNTSEYEIAYYGDLRNKFSICFATILIPLLVFAIKITLDTRIV